MARSRVKSRRNRRASRARTRRVSKMRRRSQRSSRLSKRRTRSVSKGRRRSQRGGMETSNPLMRKTIQGLMGQEPEPEPEPMVAREPEPELKRVDNHGLTVVEVNVLPSIKGDDLTQRYKDKIVLFANLAATKLTEKIQSDIASIRHAIDERQINTPELLGIAREKIKKLEKLLNPDPSDPTISRDCMNNIIFRFLSPTRNLEYKAGTEGEPPDKTLTDQTLQPDDFEIIVKINDLKYVVIRGTYDEIFESYPHFRKIPQASKNNIYKKIQR